MSTFFKVYNKEKNLEVGIVENLITFAIDSNDPTDYAYGDVGLSKDEVEELIEFLQKKKEELS